MTTIIGVQHENKCVLVADSRSTDENGRPYRHPEMVKIVEKGGYLIAGAGSSHPCDIVQYIWEPPTPPEDDLYRFMVTRVGPSIRQVVKDNGYEPKRDEEPDFIFLIAIKGELFEVDGSCTVYRRDDGYYGIGSGSSYALGALQAGADWKTAMEIAESNDVYTCRPFIEKIQYKT